MSTTNRPPIRTARMMSFFRVLFSLTL